MKEFSVEKRGQIKDFSVEKREKIKEISAEKAEVVREKTREVTREVKERAKRENWYTIPNAISLSRIISGKYMKISETVLLGYRDSVAHFIIRNQEWFKKMSDSISCYNYKFSSYNINFYSAVFLCPG